ncbi:MAG TPA: alkaline phosphatase family protein [Chloroflexota bacterium]|nr:alkaline phosphatase family protein [Chloroflexota bacterium]
MDTAEQRAESEEWLEPRYEGGSNLNLVASLAQHFGVHTGHPPLAWELPLERCEVVVLLIADGLGYHQLQGHLDGGDMPFLQRALATRWVGCAAATTVFPSTTATALTSLHCGTTPAAHGMLGYTVWLPQEGTVAELLRLWDMVADRPLRAPEQLVTVPSLYRRLAAQGVKCAVVAPGAHRGSHLSRWWFEGATYLPYDTAASIPSLVAGAVTERYRYVVAYWPGYDLVCHRFGPRSRAAADEAAALDLALARLVDGVGRLRRGLVVVVADHGQRELEPGQAVALHHDATLAPWLASPPAGERCGRFLRLRAGAMPEVAGHLGAVAEVRPMDDLWRRGVFGGPPARPDFRARTGDLLVMPRGGRQLLWAFGRAGAAPGGADPALRGGHGGCSPAEVLVPVVTLPVPSPAG